MDLTSIFGIVIGIVLVVFSIVADDGTTAATYLIEEKGVNPSKIKSSGRGEYEPVASNATSDGRGKNRRVEIKIYHQLSSY